MLPLLFALGAGKLTMVLGGAGQGQPSGAAWATAYLGPGPWSSLAPALPSHPSQAYEGIATLVVLVLAVSVLAGPGPRLGLADGRALFLGVGAWALVRAVASLTWRDPAVVGPLNAGSLIALGVDGGLPRRRRCARGPAHGTTRPPARCAGRAAAARSRDGPIRRSAPRF